MELKKILGRMVVREGGKKQVDIDYLNISVVVRVVNGEAEVEVWSTKQSWMQIVFSIFWWGSAAVAGLALLYVTEGFIQ
ncbi:hypothetical protein [Thiothrix fructosivorans]|uniref:Uncharacterized protein n=1 Tax=Thiothrix fructosivorans TaxID=111770 RepID=A0A8B0SJM1_9GAMM|nr:hypothetical protein [Thiothrix fructosivorans]MBO0611681.1 hypothetical protein [Thiothrix fructosivorans]QTX10660.1 hypothetical protein J1836_019180 [Thiothrix fructosivorans]